MKKIITIVLLSLSCFYCSAQELQTTKKENIYDTDKYQQYPHRL